MKEFEIPCTISISKVESNLILILQRGTHHTILPAITAGGRMRRFANRSWCSLSVNFETCICNTHLAC